MREQHVDGDQGDRSCASRDRKPFEFVFVHDVDKAGLERQTPFIDGAKDGLSDHELADGGREKRRLCCRCFSVDGAA